MAKTTTITMRVDGELKRQAELVCEDIGLTPSAAYTPFLKAVFVLGQFFSNLRRLTHFYPIQTPIIFSNLSKKWITLTIANISTKGAMNVEVFEDSDRFY